MSSLSIKPKKSDVGKDKEKKKRRRDSEKEGNGGDVTSKKVKVKDVGGNDVQEMQWVEKGASVATAPVQAATPGIAASSQSGPVAVAGRKKASDFM